MNAPDQVYKTHIDAAPEKVWAAITNPEFTKQYWFGNANVAAKWEQGAPWEHKGMDSGNVHHSGLIEEIVPNERLVLSWGNPGDERDVSRVTFTLKAKDNGTDLMIVHGDFIDGSQMATRVANGWPKVIANMKEFLEQGQTSQLKAACGCA
jgi:uncharacterized protein YndB with AHSA1/START domain